MTRSTLNFVVDLVSAIIGLGLVLTGLVMYFALPPGSRQLALWGWGRHDWGAVHSWLALSVIALILVHLALHWYWVCTFVYHAFTRSAASPSHRAGNVYGVVLLTLLVGLLAGFVLVARSSVEQSRGLGGRSGHDAEAAETAGVMLRGRGPAESGRPAISGSLTLAEAAQLTGQTPAQLKQRLGLEAGVSEQIRLREVADEKGWSMPELRGRITEGEK